jgi:hypothetical protein
MLPGAFWHEPHTKPTLFGSCDAGAITSLVSSKRYYRLCSKRLTVGRASSCVHVSAITLSELCVAWHKDCDSRITWLRSAHLMQTVQYACPAKQTSRAQGPRPACQWMLATQGSTACGSPSISGALTLLTGCGPPPGAAATHPARLICAILRPMNAPAASTAAPTTTGATIAAMFAPSDLLLGLAGAEGAGAGGVTGRSGWPCMMSAIVTVWGGLPSAVTFCAMLHTHNTANRDRVG